jgi:signal transduction histidine kinase
MENRPLFLAPHRSQHQHAVDGQEEHAAAAQPVERLRPPRPAIAAAGNAVQEGQPCIRVTDTGSGIPVADRPHVFERFYRSAEARAEGSGTGLGLAIARALVEAMQGRITIASTAGQGTTVTLVLPAARESPTVF